MPALPSSLISSLSRAPAVPVPEAAAGLPAARAELPDPRARRGVRHRLTVVVTAAIRAVVAGYRSYDDPPAPAGPGPGPAHPGGGGRARHRSRSHTLGGAAGDRGRRRDAARLAHHRHPGPAWDGGLRTGHGIVPAGTDGAGH